MWCWWVQGHVYSPTMNPLLSRRFQSSPSDPQRCSFFCKRVVLNLFERFKTYSCLWRQNSYRLDYPYTNPQHPPAIWNQDIPPIRTPSLDLALCYMFSVSTIHRQFKENHTTGSKTLIKSSHTVGYSRTDHLSEDSNHFQIHLFQSLPKRIGSLVR